MGVLRLALIGLALAVVGAIQAYEPLALRCEYGVDPMGIDIVQPRLFWQLRSDGKGKRQTAYQIEVASSEERLRAGGADLWDSGCRTSTDTRGVRYEGKALGPGERAFWRVRCWDEAGAVSDWSSAAEWTMGPRLPSDWGGARWIGAGDGGDNPLLRTEFASGGKLKRAMVFVCGLGQYELRLNGSKVGKNLLSPGWTDYEVTTLYDSFDVTEMIRDGGNAIGVSLGNGMYHVDREGGRFAKFVKSFGPLRAIVRLQLEYDDEPILHVESGSSWKVAAGPITYSNIYSGEDYDARLVQEGWDREGFNDSGWGKAEVMDYSLETLRGHSASAEPLVEIDSRVAVSVRALGSPGAALYDFGQNASYMPRLVVSGPAGSKVRLMPGELVEPDGQVTRSSMGGAHRGSAWWEYTKASDEKETWFPQFYYQGLRYLQTQAFPAEGGEVLPQIESLEGVIVHSEAEEAGTFATSDPLLNRIRDLVRWAQRSNMVSVLTDCPHREKLGWLEQYHLNGPAIRYEYDMARMFMKGMNDMAEAQTSDGLVPNIAPEFTVFKGRFRSAAEWGSAFIIVPWQQYQFLGDRTLLEDRYEAMQRYYTYLAGQAKDDLLAEGLGDWYDVGPEGPKSAAQLTGPELTATAFYARDAWIMSRVAEMLGKPEDARGYARDFERIRQRFNKEFFKETLGSYEPASQSANAIALAFGLAEERHRDSALHALREDVVSRGYAATAGDVGFRFLLQSLAEGGENDLIYKMLKQDVHPGYAYVLAKGATAMTESWTASRTSSHNHFMLGHVTEWFYGWLLGIRNEPGSVGFERIRIEPTPVGEVSWVGGSYETPRGKVKVRWERGEGTFQLELIVPVNATAVARIPCDTVETLEGLGPHARLIRVEGDRAVVEIGSGDFRFSSEWVGKVEE